MACDRFVHFEPDKRPSQEQVQMALEDYLGEIATVTWEKDRYIATLRGKSSNPFLRIAQVSFPPSGERWFEVWLGSNTIDVITRLQDELTNNVAEGFAKLLARYWQGRLEKD